ncbi:MAG: protein kinase domain-containing protein [Planctomycetaceae bacterium]
MHGLIFFYLRKFLAAAAPGADSAEGPEGSSTSVAFRTSRYLPTGVYPDAEAVAMLGEVAHATGAPLPDVVERFGEFLAPHLLKVAGSEIDPSWTLLDLVEHTESIIHAMVRVKNPSATPPVLETLRVDARQLQLIYRSSRRLCRLAAGLIRGMAARLGEPVEIEETSCMHRGDPFCSFVIRIPVEHTRRDGVGEEETVMCPADEVDLVVRSDDAAPPMPATIGGHRILRLLGDGGMGRVWLAHDDRLDRDVAIKVMLPETARDTANRERFLRESRAVAQIDHPHVVPIHDVGIEGGLPYIVMPYLAGGSLADRLYEERRLPVAEALRIGGEIAAGLAAAHARGLVHRDVKPDNIFLVGPGRHVRIIDFGLARDTLVTGSALTLAGSILGTPAYMAPERIADGAVDGRADLFSLGVVLSKMLSGRLPFEGRTAASVLAAITKGAAVPLAESAPDVPAEVAGLVARLIANDAAHRPVDAGAVVAEIAALKERLRD